MFDVEERICEKFGLFASRQQVRGRRWGEGDVIQGHVCVASLAVLAAIKLSYFSCYLKKLYIYIYHPLEKEKNVKVLLCSPNLRL